MPKPQQLILTLDSPTDLAEKKFLVTESNFKAYEWVNRWPQWSHHSLAIYGDKGCGKTHLGHIWRKKANATFMSASEFDSSDLPRILETQHKLVINDAENLKEEEKLFHLYNAIHNDGGNLLLLSNQPPARWVFSLPDLKSRLNVIPSIRISPPNDELLSGIIQNLFKDHQLKVDEAIISFMVKQMERSFDCARKLVETINAHSLAHKRNITLPLVREVMMQMDDSPQ